MLKRLLPLAIIVAIGGGVYWYSTRPITSLTLDNFFVRYQSITGAGDVTSASGSGTITTTSSSSGGTPVPEPSMIVLFGMGAAAVFERV